ncbi:hypothetical protein EHQ24_00005 [Leptospira noumeaensis]|uniref:HEAT repeat domain-containing protein n=1 Tax=Leptospira noumeaensis TaxID=2484964 RepID=A0A4R9IK76_9LEPT|nr:hypothetical protein [Leptospira noumeaensis]TGK89267.1 hypothetical protein EHQ24_00005 [Leptospira noumeaensis]
MNILRYFSEKKRRKEYIKNCLNEFNIKNILKNSEFRSYIHFNDLSYIDHKEKKKLIWLGLSSYSGYEREKFLHFVSENFTQEDFPFILLRTLDWVKNIRSFAINLLASKLNKVNTETLKLNSDLLINALNKQNDEENWVQLRQSILDILIKNFLNDKNKHKNDSPKYRRLIYFELINKKHSELELIIIKDTDCFNRSLIFLPIFKDYVKNNIPTLVKDNCVKIRLNIFDQFLNESPLEFQNYFETALLDDNSSIRSKANYYAKKYVNFDIRNFYIAQITTPSKLIICLSENPNEKDKDLFEQGLESTNKKVIKASLSSLKKLGLLENFKEKISNLFLFHFRLLLRLEIYKIYSLEELLNLKETFEIDNKIHYLFGLLKVKSFWVMIDFLLEQIIITKSEKFIPILIEEMNHSSRIFEKIDPILKTKIKEKINSLNSQQLINQDLSTSLLFMIKYI